MYSATNIFTYTYLTPILTSGFYQLHPRSSLSPEIEKSMKLANDSK